MFLKVSIHTGKTSSVMACLMYNLYMKKSCAYLPGWYIKVIFMMSYVFAD